MNMKTYTPTIDVDELDYPTSDGQPMAESMLQWEWIVLLKLNIDRILKYPEDVLIASDNLVYPVRGSTKICIAPDCYIAFGRPRGLRGCYKVWLEENVFPQVVMEVLSPSNTPREMEAKRQFYERYGSEEFYIIDPEVNSVKIFIRHEQRLVPVATPMEFVSPRLGVRFAVNDQQELEVVGPDERVFYNYRKSEEIADAERGRAEIERERAYQERMKADAERQKAEAERQKAETAVIAKEKLAAKLRELGIDPDTV
jgi:Uma2 family endonuclease